MILGNICTRPCGFCCVCQAEDRDRPIPTSPSAWPRRRARLGLKHVVITSVTRDDLPDGGAEHFSRAACLPCASGPARRSKC